jgi:hypothetical protein
MVIQMKDLFFFFHIMQNKFHSRHVPHIMHQPWQSLQFCMIFNHLGVVLIIYCKCMHSLFTSIHVWLGCFFTPQSFL